MKRDTYPAGYVLE